MDKKINLFIDFDDTLVDSNLALRKLYAEEFNCNIPEEITEWNGSDVLKNIKNGWVEDAFTRKEFWNHLFLKNNLDGILFHLNSLENYSMYICSIGKKENISKKIDFIDNSGLSKYFNDCIFLTKYNKDVSIGKSFLNSDSILIDDNKNNLSTIRYPILFNDGKPKVWNIGYTGHEVNGWNEGLINIVTSCYKQYINDGKGGKHDYRNEKISTS